MLLGRILRICVHEREASKLNLDSSACRRLATQEPARFTYQDAVVAIVQSTSGGAPRMSAV